MPITFGSVGDIISISLLVKDLVKALDDSQGSAREYQEVIRELWTLDRVLLEVEQLSRTHEHTIELHALCITARHAAYDCRRSIEAFYEKIRKYDRTLGAGRTGNTMRRIYPKLEWNLTRSNELDKFRAEINAHCSSMSMLLATASVNLLTLNHKRLDQQNAAEERTQATLEDQNITLKNIQSRLQENTELMSSARSYVAGIAEALNLNWLRRLSGELRTSMSRIFNLNTRIYRTVIRIESALPSRLERGLIQEPFLLEDAIGRLFPVHLQFVASWDAFDAVLETQFRNLQGHSKIMNKEFVLQEHATRRDISRMRPWDGAFLPGQKVEMSIIFINFTDARQEINPSCPGCQKVCDSYSEAGMQCTGCGMWFGRVIELCDTEPDPSASSQDVPVQERAPFAGPVDQDGRIAPGSASDRRASLRLTEPGQKHLGGDPADIKPSKKRSLDDDSTSGAEISHFKRVRVITRQLRVRKPISRPSLYPRTHADGLTKPIASNIPLHDEKEGPKETFAQTSDAECAIPETSGTLFSLLENLVPKKATPEKLDSEELADSASLDSFDDVDDDGDIYDFSLESNIYDYEVEEGRTYHAYKKGMYYMPNDENERDRMDMQHHAILLLLGNKLFLAPVDTPKQILDQGTGTGIWVIDVAEKYPDSKVLGTDLSPIQPTWVPPNASFEIYDVDESWLHRPETFDFVHCCLGNGFSGRDWDFFLAESYRNVVPGGWVEVKDIDYVPMCNDGTLPQDSAIVRWHTKLQQGASLASNVNLRFDGAELAKRFSRAGFINVKIVESPIPMGVWPKDRRMRNIGRWWQQIFHDGLEAYSLAIFNRLLRWPRPKLESLLDEVRQEVKTKSYHWYWPFYVVYGQKPPN